MVLICHRYKFIFLKTRKTAGTSVEAAVQLLMGDNGHQAIEEETDERVGDNGIVGRRLQGKRLMRENNTRLNAIQRAQKASYHPRVKHYRKARALWYHHKPAAEVKRDLGDGIWETYHKMSIVRNPWDKVVSLWKWKTKNGATDLAFREFVLRLQHSDDWHIHSLDNRRACNTYIRFENIEEGLRRAMGRIGVSEEDQTRVLEALPHYKDSNPDQTQNEKAYRSYYDDLTRDHVAHVYRREIGTFRYKF